MDSNRTKGPKDGCRSYDLQDVQFAYPLAPENQVLKGVSLSVCSSWLRMRLLIDSVLWG